MKLKAKVEGLQQSQRHMLGEDLGPLSSKELEQLEQQLDISLKQIRSTKRLVRLTFEHPLYPIDYTFPSHEEDWVVTKLSKKKKEYEEGRKQGSVLVHYFAGVSRSAAVTIAYLMRSEHLSFEDALESLKKSCKSIGPNAGFKDQLKIFEEMGFKVDHASIIYKRYHMKKLGWRYPSVSSFCGNHLWS